MQDNMFLHWLKKRGITEQVISDFNIHSGDHAVIGDCITIPIKDEAGVFSFNKYRRNPTSDDKPKYLYDKGGKVSLYGWDLAKDADNILITEGEMDALVAWSHHIPAVTSTGGAMSFQSEWADLLADKEVTLCFDNDVPGARGMVKVLNLIPHAYIVFLPDRPGVKDISDYVASGGNLEELLRTKVRFTCLQDIVDHRSNRLSLWLSTFFHDSYIEANTTPTYTNNKTSATSDELTRARAFPITDILRFRAKKTKCIWHTEKTASLTYYPKTNTTYCFGCGQFGDAISVYRQVNNCSFKKAIHDLS